MTRSEIINLFIKKYNYKRYLEIGVNTPAQPGYNWDNINTEIKHGVDPAEKVHATFPVTSDEFFAKHISIKYDIIFVDGLHIFDQAYRDIVHSLEWLNDNGTIVVHDCNPLSESTQRPVHTPGVWLGDVWKAILKLRMEREDISIFTIDADFGCGIIRKGNQKLFTSDKPTSELYTYDFFDAHRKEILNLVSPRQFRTMMEVPTTSDTILNSIEKITSKLISKKEVTSR